MSLTGSLGRFSVNRNACHTRWTQLQLTKAVSSVTGFTVMQGSCFFDKECKIAAVEFMQAVGTLFY